MFWMCSYNSAGSTGMFYILLSSSCLVSIEAFSAFHSALPVSRHGVNKKLGGDTPGTADPR